MILKILSGLFLSVFASAAVFQYGGIKHDITSQPATISVIVLNSASTQVQRITGSSAQDLKLPDATTLRAGYWYRIVNESTGTMTIRNSSSLLLGSLAAGSTSSPTYAQLYLTSNSTSGGPWTFEKPSAGSSGTGITGDDFGDQAVTITPSAGFGTTTGTTMKCRRVGDSVQCFGVFTNGTVAASEAYIDIGATWTIDTAKVFSGAVLGKGISIGNGGSFNFYTAAGFSQVLFYDGTTATRLYFGFAGAGGVVTKNVGSDLNQTGGVQQFEFTFPVSGWTAN